MILASTYCVGTPNTVRGMISAGVRGEVGGDVQAAVAHAHHQNTLAMEGLEDAIGVRVQAATVEGQPRRVPRRRRLPRVTR